jgi:hypothetical protein
MCIDTSLTEEDIHKISQTIDKSLFLRPIIKWNELPIKQVAPWKYIDFDKNFTPSIYQIYSKSKLTVWQRITRWLKKLWRKLK